MIPFLYESGQTFVGPEVSITVTEQIPGASEKGWLPAYKMAIHRIDDVRFGTLDLRLGYTDSVVRYGGHLGYSVEESFRGHRYAMKACRLAQTIFAAHGMDCRTYLRAPGLSLH